MLTINFHKAFKKDYKRILRRGYDVHLLEQVIQLLVEQKTLPPKYKDHLLEGSYAGYRECHITPDWLIIYKIEHQQLTLTLTRTGTHSDLFK